MGFPEEGWSDFPVVILAWWIEGLAGLVAGRERSFQGHFMDGPFAFVLERGAGAAGRIAWGENRTHVSVGIVEVASLLRSAVTAGRQVAQECQARQWSNRDLETLERVIARSAV